MLVRKRFGMALIATLLAVGTSCEPSGIAAGGAGGENDPAGGTGGAAGAGGDSGGGAGGDQGKAGVGGVLATGEGGWLDAPSTWKAADLKNGPDGFKVFEGIPGQLQFPPPTWESCGIGCESTILAGENSGDITLSTAGDTFHTIAYAAVGHGFQLGPSSWVVIRRIIRLSDGVTVAALRLEPHMRDSPLTGGLIKRFESALGILLRDSSAELDHYTIFDPSKGWDFKEPGDESDERAIWCHQFDLESSPPSMFFACRGGMQVMQDAGSSAITLIPDSKGSVVGAGSHGLAVWSERSGGEVRTSRIRAWVPGEEVRLLAQLPDDICAVGVGRDRVVGFHGMDLDRSGYCNGELTNPRFFWIPREGGEVVQGPVLEGDPRWVSTISTWGDYAAAIVVRPGNVSYEERTSVVLIRLSDWKMRSFRTPFERRILSSTVAVDAEHLYFDVNFNLPGNSCAEKVYRYRLDQFDEIGEPIQ